MSGDNEDNQNYGCKLMEIVMEKFNQNQKQCNRFYVVILIRGEIITMDILGYHNLSAHENLTDEMEYMDLNPDEYDYFNVTDNFEKYELIESLPDVMKYIENSDTRYIYLQPKNLPEPIPSDLQKNYFNNSLFYGDASPDS